MSDENSLSKISTEKLEQSSIKISSQISKCNMACSSLMKGLSWESIEMKLDNWKENEPLKAKKEMAQKIKDNKEATKDNTEKDEKHSTISAIKNTFSNTSDKTRHSSEIDKNEEEKSLTVFEEKHPRLSAIKNWFGNMFNKIRYGSHMEKASKSEIQKEEQEKEKIEISKSKNEDFKKYLKEIAEKGDDAITTQKKEEAIKTLIENKKKALGNDGGTISKLESKLNKNDDGR